MKDARDLEDWAIRIRGFRSTKIRGKLDAFFWHGEVREFRFVHIWGQGKQICSTDGPSIDCVRQVDFGNLPLRETP